MCQEKLWLKYLLLSKLICIKNCDQQNQRQKNLHIFFLLEKKRFCEKMVKNKKIWDKFMWQPSIKWQKKKKKKIDEKKNSKKKKKKKN